MAEFYVEINAQDSGEHMVHRAECSLLPSKETIRYLGSIASCASALKKAVQSCPHCATTCHTA